MGEPKLKPGIDTGMEMIRPSQLNVDMGYQRDPKRRMKKIAGIVKKFDRRLLGVFHVSRRRDGSLWVIDGAGRKLAMERIGDDSPVTCVVHYHINSVEEEAEWFLRLNPDEVAKVNAGQKFKARLAANDSSALEVNKNAMKGGLVVTGIGKDGISVQAATCLHVLGCLTRVGFIKKAAWEGYKTGGAHYVALGAVLAACPGINEDRLRRTLKENPPAVLYSATLAEYGASGVGHARLSAAKMARTLVKIFNHHASAHRIQPNWSRVDDILAIVCKDQWAVIDD